MHPGDVLSALGAVPEAKGYALAAKLLSVPAPATARVAQLLDYCDQKAKSSLWQSLAALDLPGALDAWAAFATRALEGLDAGVLWVAGDDVGERAHLRGADVDLLAPFDWSWKTRSRSLGRGVHSCALIGEAVDSLEEMLDVAVSRTFYAVFLPAYYAIVSDHIGRALSQRDRLGITWVVATIPEADVGLIVGRCEGASWHDFGSEVLRALYDEQVAAIRPTLERRRFEDEMIARWARRLA
jgi:hypothetical protein